MFTQILHDKKKSNYKMRLTKGQLKLFTHILSGKDCQLQNETYERTAKAGHSDLHEKDSQL